jgi:hypothetical protein
MIFSNTIQVDGQLACTSQLGGAACQGRGQAGNDQVLISTSGAADGSTAVVSLRDAPPSATVDPTAHARSVLQRSSHRHHHRHHRHHRHLRQTGG